jgi:tRNA(Ile)-lysidine synthase
MAAALLTADDLPAGEAPLLVGFSGGLDSTVLLHALAALPAARQRGLRALHVHHGLHPDADAWSQACGQACAALDVPLEVARVQVARERGDGPEAAARAARYGAYAEALRDGEVLVLAHHRDDQAETFLLRALRGSGVDGLVAMRAWRPFLRGWLWRPLLAHAPSELRGYAQAQALHWLDDPSNADLAFDRNFLRHRVLPLLRQRWPQADAGFARSAGLLAQAQQLLQDDDRRLLEDALTEAGRALDLRVFGAAPAARRARALRAWIGDLGLPPLPAEGIVQVETQLLAARSDAEPRFAWAGAELRRWRHLLHAARVATPLAADWQAMWNGDAPLPLPAGDVLALAPDGMARPAGAFAPPWHVRARQGGERIHLPGRAHSHTLKHVLQERAVPPWVRERLPLLFAGDGTLLAAGDLVFDGEFARWLRDAGLRLEWHRNPAG